MAIGTDSTARKLLKAVPAEADADDELELEDAGAVSVPAVKQRPQGGGVVWFTGGHLAREVR